MPLRRYVKTEGRSGGHQVRFRFFKRVYKSALILAFNSSGLGMGNPGMDLRIFLEKMIAKINMAQYSSKDGTFEFAVGCRLCLGTG